MSDMAAAALRENMAVYGFSPHSPVPVDSPCNMAPEAVACYLDRASRLRDEYAGRMDLLTSMEIDFLSPDFGPHIDYFQRMPLHYRIGSVHFVPTRTGVPVDCDGSYERFAVNLREAFGGDLRYVVEKYFEQVLTMLERGGFDILGHFDKIAGNASQALPSLEEQGWYAALVEDVASHAVSAGVAVEINTKAFEKNGRMFPASRWWQTLAAKGLTVVVDSDAHYPDRINSGRNEALSLLREMHND